jgi:murein DD-endopeptidase MepM/ murein hydrolase activator NlpD
VPIVDGDAMERASSLALGTRETAVHLLNAAPRAEWVGAVRSPPASDLLWPVENGTFGRGYGRVRRSSRRLHRGVDISAPGGTAVRAVNDGLVAYADNGVRGMGNVVMVVHSDGTMSLYAHLRAAWVGAGTFVRRGQTIGELGSTGLARGPHLHFQWHVEGRPRNPMRRFARRTRAIGPSVGYREPL